MELIEKQAAIEAVGLNTWAGSRISQLPTVEAIPIEWLKENYGGLQIVRYIMADWKREKELNK